MTRHNEPKQKEIQEIFCKFEESSVLYHAHAHFLQFPSYQWRIRIFLLGGDVRQFFPSSRKSHCYQNKIGK